jgi:hypothetical protein
MMASPPVLRRPVALAALVLTALAIALGRGQALPEVEGDRRPEAPRYHFIRAYAFRRPEDRPRLLDAVNGCLMPGPVLRDGSIADAACSPWRDDRGRSQMVGPWKRGRGQGDRREVQVVGLARFTVPDGELLDRVPLDIPTASRPCWLPGPAARVLFAAGDGRLYRLDFDDGPGGRPARAAGERRPRPLAWRAEAPAPHGLFLAEPTWPADPRLGGRIVASAIIPGRPGVRTADEGQHLWWLRLDPGATAIEAAVRLTVPASAGAARVPDDERLPALGTAPDGTLVLAYLARPAGEPRWQLRLAPVAIDPAGDPGVDPASAQMVARQCAASPPVFSPDGRWVYAVLDRGEGAPALVVRHEVAEALAGRSGPPPDGRPPCALPGVAIDEAAPPDLALAAGPGIGEDTGTGHRRSASPNRPDREKPEVGESLPERRGP